MSHDRVQSEWALVLKSMTTNQRYEFDLKYTIVIGFGGSDVPAEVFDEIKAIYKDQCGVQSVQSKYVLKCETNVTFKESIIFQFDTVYLEMKL